MFSPPRLFKPLLRGARRRSYPRGQIMYYQGDTPFEVMVLKSGIVKIYDTDDNGNEKILQLMKPWAVLPLAIFSGENIQTHWFYEALTDCEVYALPAAEMLEAMQADTKLAIHLMNWFSLEVHELLVRLSSLGKTNARDKMIAALKFLALHHAKARPRGPWRRVTFPVNHQLLANMTGITRESAAATMKQLQDEGISRYPKQTMLELNARKLGQGI